MKKFEIDINTRVLSRDIINICWWIIGLYIVATGIQVFLTDNDPWAFFLQVTLLPTLSMSFLWCLLEIYYRYVNRYLEYAVCTAVNLLISVMIITLYEIPLASYLLIYPLLISLFYYRENIIRFVFAQQMITLIVLYLVSANIRAYLQFSNLIMLIAMLIATAMVIMKLKKRATEMIDMLQSTIEEKQELHSKNIMMQKINLIDAATNLYNHKSFHEHLDNILSMQEAYKMDVHLAVLDIDNFKRVNDTFGHSIGDIVIKFVADCITDGMEPDDFASRYGGEEFAILTVGKSTEYFYEQIERIREAIARRSHDVLEGQAVTVSIGYQKLQDSMSKSQFFERADSSLYEAKKSGKNCTIGN